MTHKAELVAQVMKSCNVWHARKPTGSLPLQNYRTLLTDLTEELSREINAAKASIAEYLAAHPEFVTEELLLTHMPRLPGTLHRPRGSPP